MRLAQVLLVMLLLLGVACAKRPVLYPNQHLEEVGAAASKQDIDDCMELARSADLDKNQAADAAKKTGAGAAVGAAGGPVGGAISGGVGRGAAIGAGVGAVGGFFSWLFGSGEPDPVFVRYVDTCLAERGYQPIGWK